MPDISGCCLRNLSLSGFFPLKATAEISVFELISNPAPIKLPEDVKSKNGEELKEDRPSLFFSLSFLTPRYTDGLKPYPIK